MWQIFCLPLPWNPAKWPEHRHPDADGKVAKDAPRATWKKDEPAKEPAVFPGRFGTSAGSVTKNKTGPSITLPEELEDVVPLGREPVPAPWPEKTGRRTPVKPATSIERMNLFFFLPRKPDRAPIPIPNPTAPCRQAFRLRPTKATAPLGEQETRRSMTRRPRSPRGRNRRSKKNSTPAKGSPDGHSRASARATQRSTGDPEQAAAAAFWPTPPGPSMPALA